MVYLNPIILGVTFNRNGKNIPIKIMRMSDPNFLNMPHYILATRNTI